MIARRPLLACLLVTAVARADVPPPAPLAGLPVPPSAVAVISEGEARLELARVLAYAERFEQALVEYDRALVLRPDDTAARAERGQLLGWLGRREEAVAALSELPPDDLPPAAAVLLADLILGDQKFPEAAALYRRALAADPADHGTRFKLARVLSWQNQLDDSLAEFDLLLAALPDDIQVRRHRAQVLGWAGRHEEAAEEWRRTLPASP